MSERINPHIDYGIKTKPYHTAICELVEEYGTDESTLLDIGCGSGILASMVKSSNQSIKLSVADIDKNLLEMTGTKLMVEESIHINDVSDLFSRGKKYDVVVMSHVLEHTFVPKDLVNGIISNLVSENGHLILAVPNLGRPEVFFLHLFKRNYVNKGHVYGWDRPHWMNFLENICGVNVVKYESDYLAIPVLKKIAFLDKAMIKLGRRFSWLGYSNIAVIKNVLIEV